MSPTQWPLCSWTVFSPGIWTLSIPMWPVKRYWLMKSLWGQQCSLSALRVGGSDMDWHGLDFYRQILLIPLPASQFCSISYFHFRHVDVHKPGTQTVYFSFIMKCKHLLFPGDFPWAYIVIFSVPCNFHLWHWSRLEPGLPVPFHPPLSPHSFLFPTTSFGDGF